MRQKTLLLLLILLGWGIHPLRAQQPQVECWMDSQGLWAWGFADRFAVYGNRPWQYESDRKDGSRRILTLRHGDERLRAVQLPRRQCDPARILAASRRTNIGMHLQQSLHPATRNDDGRH